MRQRLALQLDPELVGLYQDRVNALIFGAVIPAKPIVLDISFYWIGQITFREVNPKVDASGASLEVTKTTQMQLLPHVKLGHLCFSTSRVWLPQRKHNSGIQLAELLQRPVFKST